MERPIAFYLRKLLQRERNYSTVEKECLGLVCALKHFDVYLVGRHFEIMVDHRALTHDEEFEPTADPLGTGCSTIFF